MKKKIAIVTIYILLLATLIFGAFLWKRNKNQNSSQNVNSQYEVEKINSNINNSIKEKTEVSMEGEENIENEMAKINIWSYCEEKARVKEDVSEKLKELDDKLKPDSSKISLSQSDLTIKSNGHMYYQDKDISESSKQVYFKGDLNLNSEYLTKLPDNLFVGGNLIIHKVKSKLTLPKSIYVEGNMAISGDFNKMSDKLFVKKHLSAYDTKIEALSENMMVGGGLDVHNTFVKSLPKNIFVAGSIDLRNTNISELPTNLSVSGDLNLDGSNIKQLPCGLSIENTLVISGTSIGLLPSDVKIGKILDARSTPLSSILRENSELLSGVNNKLGGIEIYVSS